MLRSILARLAAHEPEPPPPVPPRVPLGQRLYAVGDIHGRDDLLAQLVERIEADDAARGPAETTIILLGDLVDRGPASAAVVERAHALAQRRRVRLLAANHEEVMLNALGGSIEALRFFCRIGGEETIASYGMSRDAMRGMAFDELLPRFQVAVPPHHADFLRSAEDWIAIGDYVFVHAGIRPGVALAAQKPADLRWIREPFLDDPRWHGAMIVHGHTITPAVDARPNRLGIDTGAYASGRLTAVGLEGPERWFLEG